MGLEDIVNDNQERLDELEKVIKFLLETRHIATQDGSHLGNWTIQHWYDEENKD